MLAVKNKNAGLLLSVFFFSSQAFAHGAHSHGKPMSEAEQQAAEGIFNNQDVKERSLKDWDGIWQSVYPLLISGELDPVLQKKAKKDKEKDFQQFKAYYRKGYATDITTLAIENDFIEFRYGDKTSRCRYHYAGHKILTYASGKKGVRYLFDCLDANSTAPKYVQFSDHTISPRQSAHFHLFMGNTSQEALLKEMDNWPTFYPWQLSNAQVVDEMLHH